ncbi:MAG TPA: SDR family NAD(P)-dependent oxidoreductase [Rhodoblastus sp.]|nr:SDR family NAD(P)-dependent oxidoreductase [Rhodoblastus sp.]
MIDVPETDDEALAAHPTVYAADAYAGRTALISGGAGGLGRACAWLLGRLGAQVILTGRSAEKLEAATAAMRGKGLSAHWREVDIRDRDSVEALYAWLESQDFKIDALVNSAGGQFPQAAIDFSEKGWSTVINTNLNGAWRMMQGAARGWRQRGAPGAIVNIVVVTRQGLYGVAHTVAARAGVIALSENLAVEWAPLNIRVNCIAPGAIATPGWRVYQAEQRATYARSNPMLRAGGPWEVAEACAYLAGSAAEYVTGETLHVAGGAQLWGETWTIPRPGYFSA